MENSIELVRNGKMVSNDTLQLIITAANLAGYMEKEDKIDVPDDTALMEFIVSAYNDWSTNVDYVSWDEYIEAALEKRFGPSKVYILVCYTEQTDFLDMHGERADDVSSILGVYSTKEEAETQRAEYETTLNASEYVNSWTQIIEKTLDKPVC